MVFYQFFFSSTLGVWSEVFHENAGNEFRHVGVFLPVLLQVFLSEDVSDLFYVLFVSNIIICEWVLLMVVFSALLSLTEDWRVLLVDLFKTGSCFLLIRRKQTRLRWETDFRYFSQVHHFDRGHLQEGDFWLVFHLSVLHYICNFKNISSCLQFGSIFDQQLLPEALLWQNIGTKAIHFIKTNSNLLCFYYEINKKL